VDQIFGPETRAISLPFHFSPGKVEMPDAAKCRWSGNGVTGELICADGGSFDDRKITSGTSGLVSRGSQDTPAAAS
jgi:hypothetical protein